MYFVINLKTNETEAMTKKEEVAKMVSIMCDDPCEVKFSEIGQKR